MSGFGSKSANTFSNAAPSNYIAGIGRGAMGFTTRSDIGPARPAVSVVSTVDPVFGQAPAGYVAGRGRGMGELARDQGELTTKHVQEDADRGDYSESNYDEFAGYGGALFSSAGTPYDEDDAEADKIYDQVGLAFSCVTISFIHVHGLFLCFIRFNISLHQFCCNIVVTVLVTRRYRLMTSWKEDTSVAVSSNSSKRR